MSNQPNTEAKFPLGQVVATPAAVAALEQNGQTPMEFLKRHVSGDWGDCCPEDQYANEKALKWGERIFSVYHLNDKTKIWIITTAADKQGQRESSCLLLPADY